MKKLFLLAVTVLLTGCYSYGNYKPTVDTFNDKNAYRLDQDAAECREIALQASGSGTATETAKGVGVGAILGAVGGVVGGAFAGSPGLGAAIGSAGGALVGGGYQGFTSEDRFRNAYNQCMSGRGHKVIR